jgi:multisubunit Na+/H+ antiporter MnhE subunit
MVRREPGQINGTSNAPELTALECGAATTGTVCVEYDAQHGTMLLRVLELAGKKAWVRTIKGRWERRLMEIFE